MVQALPECKSLLHSSRTLSKTVFLCPCILPCELFPKQHAALQAKSKSRKNVFCCYRPSQKQHLQSPPANQVAPLPSSYPLAKPHYISHHQQQLVAHKFCLAAACLLMSNSRSQCKRRPLQRQNSVIISEGKSLLCHRQMPTHMNSKCSLTQVQLSKISQ